MNLKINNEITIKSWLNETQITDDTWEIYSRDENDVLFIFAKDPKTGNEMKIKVEKSAKSTEETKS